MIYHFLIAYWSLLSYGLKGLLDNLYQKAYFVDEMLEFTTDIHLNISVSLSLKFF